jgi:uncharacterized membrane protein
MLLTVALSSVRYCVKFDGIVTVGVLLLFHRISADPLFESVSTHVHVSEVPSSVQGFDAEVEPTSQL